MSLSFNNRGFTVDYTGRQVDVSIVQALPVNGNVPAVLDFPNPAQVVSGVQKVVQNWLVMFLTRRGTNSTDSAIGTTFLDQLIRGELRDDPDVVTAFSVAASDISEYVQQATLGQTLPADEVITDVQLLNGWSLEAGTLKLRIGFTTLAGTTRQVLVPVSLPIV